MKCFDSKTRGEIWRRQGRDGAAGKHHDDIVRDVAYSASGELIVSVSRDQSLKLWRATDGVVVAEPLLPASAGSVAISKDNLVAVGLAPDLATIDHAPEKHPAPIVIYRVQESGDRLSFEPVKTLHGCVGAVKAVAFSPDGQRLLGGSQDGQVLRWSVPSFTKLDSLQGHAGLITSLCISNDGARIAVGSGDYRKRWLSGELTVWSSSDDSILWRSHDHVQAIDGLAFAPGDQLLATASWDETAKIWNPETGEVLESIPAHSSRVSCVCFGFGSHELFTGGGDDTVRHWMIDRASPREVLRGHRADVEGLEYSFDNEFLLTTGGDKTVKLWHAADGQWIRDVTKSDERLNVLACSPTSHVVVIGGGPYPLSNSPAPLEIWDYQKNVKLHSLAYRGKLVDAKFSPNGQQFATGDMTGLVTLWDVPSGEAIHRFEDNGAKGPVTRLCFSSNEKWIVAGHRAAIDILDIESHRLVSRIKTGATNGSYGIAVSPDSRTLAIGGWDGQIVFRSISEGGYTRTLKGHSDSIISLSFSPDGKRLVSGGKDGSVKVWDIATGLDVMNLRDLAGWVWRVKFSSDSQMLAIGSSQAIHDQILILMRAARATDRNK